MTPPHTPDLTPPACTSLTRNYLINSVRYLAAGKPR